MSIVVTDNSPRVHYTATAGQTSFVVPFAWIANSDLTVYVNEVLMTFQAPPSNQFRYSTTGEGVSAGGSITFGPPGRLLNDQVVIFRDMPIQRVTDLPTSGVFPVASLNDGLDGMTAMMQQTEVGIDKRVLRMYDYDFVHPLRPIPTRPIRAGRLLGFDSEGQPVCYDAAGGGGFSGIGEAPIDGNIYGRFNASWTLITIPAAPVVDATYIVQTLHAGLSAERALADTPTVSWDFSVASTAKAKIPDNLTTGFTSTAENLGTISSGTVTPNPLTGQYKRYVNNGAHTLAPPSVGTGDSTDVVIQITNGASAGAVTTSGYTKVDGAFTTTNGKSFLCYTTRCNSISYLNIVAMP